jgi:hypothetical protein
MEREEKDKGEGEEYVRGGERRRNLLEFTPEVLIENFLLYMISFQVLSIERSHLFGLCGKIDWLTCGCVKMRKERGKGKGESKR